MRFNAVELTRKWVKLNPGIAEKGRIAKREYKKRYYSNHPDVYEAHKRITNAIAAGRLPRAKELICLDCGRQAGHYHHNDYSTPLEVIPLCCSCHRKRHRISYVKNS